MPPTRRENRRAKRAATPCSLPLVAQVDARDAATVRRGEHPRHAVKRLDLLSDLELDELRARHPASADAAMDVSLLLDGQLEQVLAARGLSPEHLESLPIRPLLSVFVCLACGATAVGTAQRSWEIDRAMRELGLAERDLQEGSPRGRPGTS